MEGGRDTRQHDDVSDWTRLHREPNYWSLFNRATRFSKNALSTPIVFPRPTTSYNSKQATSCVKIL